MNALVKRLAAVVMTAATLALASCSTGTSADEEAAAAALTTYLGTNLAPGATIDDQQGPWLHGDAYAFLLRGSYTSQNGTHTPVTDELLAVYSVREEGGVWGVTQEASFGPRDGRWEVMLFGGEHVEIDPENKPHRAVCLVLESREEGQPQSCDAISD